MEISQDGELLVLVIGNVTKRWIELIDLVSNKLLHTIHTEYCRSVKISPNKQYIAVMVRNEASTVTVYSVDTVQEVCLLDGCVDVEFTDGDTIFGIRKNREVTIAEIPSSDVTTHSLHLQGDIECVHYIPVTDMIIFSCDTGAAGNFPVSAAVYRASALGMLGTISGISKGGLCDLSSDGDICIDNSLQIFDLAQCQKLKRLQDSKLEKLSCVRLSRNGVHAVWIDTRPTDCVKVCRVADSTVIAACCLHAMPASITFLASADIMVVTSKDRHVYTLALCDPEYVTLPASEYSEERLHSVVRLVSSGGAPHHDIAVKTLPATVQEELRQQAEINKRRNMNFEVNTTISRKSTQSELDDDSAKTSSACVLL
jgi:hypothetical protein